MANADGRADGVAEGITVAVGRYVGGLDVGCGSVGTAVGVNDGAVEAVATDGTDVVVVVVGEIDGLTDETIADGGTLVCASDDGIAVGNRVGMITSMTLIPTILSSEMFKTCAIDIFHASAAICVNSRLSNPNSCCLM